MLEMLISQTVFSTVINQLENYCLLLSDGVMLFLPIYSYITDTFRFPPR